MPPQFNRNGPISTLPIGLLGLLGIKNEGHNPSDLGDVVLPQLNMLPWYAMQAFEQLADNAACITGAHGDNISSTRFLVPAGQTWLVRGFQCYCGVAATDVAVFAATVLQSLNGQFYPFLQGPTVGYQAGLTAPGGAAASYVQSVVPGPFLMRSGDTMGFGAYQMLAAVSNVIQLRAQILRFTT